MPRRGGRGPGSRRGETAQAAMEIAAWAAEEQRARWRSAPGCRGSDAVAAWRRPGCRRAKRLPMTSCAAVAQAVEERIEAAEIIAVVAVAHDDEAAARGANAGDQRAAVAFLRHVDHARAVPPGQGLRAVGAAVVGDQHLADDAGTRKEAVRLVDAALRRVSASLRQGIRMVRSSGGAAASWSMRRRRRVVGVSKPWIGAATESEPGVMGILRRLPTDRTRLLAGAMRGFTDCFQWAGAGVGQTA